MAKDVRTIMDAMDYVDWLDGKILMPDFPLLTGCQKCQLQVLVADPYWQGVFVEEKQ